MPSAELTVPPSFELPPLQFYNTLTRSLEVFTPIEPQRVKMYVCGPTVYDDAHLGHARCNITWDVLYRLLQWWGFDTLYARNVTDVDDKILKRALERASTPEAVATLNYARFAEDMQALHTLPPSVEPKATEHIEAMWSMTHTLLERGFAYVQPDGSVYFRTQAMGDYGKLSKKPIEALQAGARVSIDEGKEHPADFALWKAAPADAYGWQSPWGWGRPGWHIECSAMIRSILGEQIDIHCGGADLVFPHHENEIAQSECCTGKRPFVRTWMHNGFVTVDGEKMGKSLGNFATVRDLLPMYDANTLRYFMLTNHYRMPVDFTPDALNAAKTRIHKLWRQLVEALYQQGYCLEQWHTLVATHYQSGQLGQSSQSASVGKPEGGLPPMQEFIHAMAKDMNTPKALAAWNAAFKQAKQATTHQALEPWLACLLQQAWVLGFDVAEVGTLLAEKWKQASTSLAVGASAEGLIDAIEGLPVEVTLSTEVQAMLDGLAEQRWQAKHAKAFDEADALRSQFAAHGFTVIDLPKGHCRLVWQGLTPASESTDVPHA
jgi:cysteinyl-tRNA synthetase